MQINGELQGFHAVRKMQKRERERERERERRLVKYLRTGMDSGARLPSSNPGSITSLAV